MFCIAKGLEDLGTAKFLDADNQEATIEFFDSPAIEGRIKRTVARASVIRRPLGPNTRVYFHDPEQNRWQVGRVLDDGDDSSLIRFANKMDRVVSHDYLFVRWRKPITDPTLFLSDGITETPQYADARSGFLSSYIAQRAAAGGISALLSSTIELETHQIRVIQRVLNDSSQRHLLADEVGLGKTIEAGVIVRQAVLDDPKAHRIVVVAPTSLTHQWRTELAKRFGLDDLIEDSVLIHSLQDTEAIETSLAGATMLVVDEAHHLTALNDDVAMRTYATVSRHAASIDRVLLLSATPALRNEVGFLRMLHLLDPAVYRLEDEAAFKDKIAHRQSLAEAVAFLNPQNVLSLEPVLDDLAQKLPTDSQLQALIAGLRARLMDLPDAEDPGLEHSILKLRAHLSETYRLHRRILRNRRKSLRFITPERCGSDFSIVRGWDALRIESMLEDWRLHALALCARNTEAASELISVYLGMVSAFVEDPRKLAPLCDERMQRLASASGLNSFRDELSLLEEIRNGVDDGNWLRSRLDSLTEVVRKLVSSSKKAVVFCAEESTADAVSSHLQSSRVGKAVRHSNAAEEDSWRNFQSGAKVDIIVCGPAAEEGLNLQGGEKAVVHFDLPLAPNRIEQRIGRVDRYGSGSSIRSTALLDEGSQLQLGWYTLLERGLCVFSRSIASLQYLLEDEWQRLGRVLFRDGSECFDNLLAEYSGPNGKVTRELELLDQQDALDELTPLADPRSEALEDADSNWKPINETVTHWAVETLLFDKVLERDTANIRAPDPPYRFRYQKPGSGGPATLIPLAGFLYDFIGALDVEAPGASANQPLSHKYSAHRKTAVARGARVLRYGDAFVEALKSYSDTDDRGRSFGIWRRHDGGPETGFALYFRFDFLVEARLEETEPCLAQAGLLHSAAARAAIRRRGDGLFAPTTIRIWLTEDGEAVDPHVIETYLALPYSKDPGVASYADTNLSSERLRGLKQSLPEIFATWSERCDRMRDFAQTVVLENEGLLAREAKALRHSDQESALRAAQLEARIHSLQGVEADKERASLKLEQDLHKALRAGIARPLVKLDVVGFVMLSRHSYTRFSAEDEGLA